MSKIGLVIIVISVITLVITFVRLSYLKRNKEGVKKPVRESVHDYFDILPSIEDFLGEIRLYEFTGILHISIYFERQELYLTLKNGSVGIVSNACATDSEPHYKVYITNVTDLIGQVERANGDEINILRILNSITCVRGAPSDDLDLALSTIS